MHTVRSVCGTVLSVCLSVRLSEEIQVCSRAALKDGQKRSTTSIKTEIPLAPSYDLNCSINRLHMEAKQLSSLSSS